MEGQSAATGDAQSPQAPRGQEYGVAGAQLAVQQAVPLPNSSQSSPHSAAMASATGAPPGSGVPLSADTMYPGEPVTTGLPIGPGAGPESLMLASTSPELSELRAIYQRYGGESLRRLIEWSETNL